MSLELTGLSLRKPDGSPLIGPISLTVPKGQIVTIMGPSGIGKSTLLDAIGGHLDPDFAVEGGIRLDGQDLLAVPAEARRVGLVFQEAALFPHLSVGDNLAFGLTPAVRGRATRRAVVAQALEQAGLPGFEGRDPATLSGGQRARVALMRSLLAQPRALLLDEPFSRLDAVLRDEIRTFTFSHAREQGIPVLLVTHDEGDARAAGGPILRL